MGLSSVNVCGVAPTYYASVISTQYEKSHIIATKGGCRVMLVKGYNSNAAKQFIQLHDSATVPAEGAVPMSMMVANATDNFSFLIPVCGLPPTVNGLVICNSSTGPTKTIGGNDCWFEVYYL